MNLREPHTFIQSHELHSLSDSIEKEKIISIKKYYNKRRRTCKEIARINDIPQFRSELPAALDAPPPRLLAQNKFLPRSARREWTSSMIENIP